jgi:8-oxo-dGTP diphosphatase
MRNKIKNIISNIKPFDVLEEQHIEDVLFWMDSGVEIFRIEKPATPNKHLVSYFALFDEEAKKMLLVDHKKAELWLPAGGHVEPGEDPKITVQRECLEELGVKAEFFREDPLFITVTETVGKGLKHTDVSLWYVIKGKSADTYIYDQGEFNGIKWFNLDEIPYEKSDPYMRRFIDKLRAIL